jgi:glycerophosphoryl diester phosphodiesterase
MARQTQVFAHRGAKTVAPENTLPAFQAALDMGVDGIELDVQRSADGQLFIMHNFTVDATTNGQGKVADLTAAQLARLDAGRWFDPAFAGVGVPTLQEVFDLVGRRCRINVEIKSQDALGGGEVELVAALIRDRQLYDQVIVSSFNPITLIKMRWYDRKIRLGLLYSGQPLPPHLAAAWLSPVMRPEALHPHHALVDAEFTAWAKSIPAAVNTWTVNDVDEAKRLAGLGVDAIISDVPDRIMAALA